MTTQTKDIRWEIKLMDGETTIFSTISPLKKMLIFRFSIPLFLSDKSMIREFKFSPLGMDEDRVIFGEDYDAD